MKILYGTTDYSIDVTDICLTKLKTNNTIVIPPNDFHRAHFFGDPVFGMGKKIFITQHNETIEYSPNFKISIDLNANTISSIHITDEIGVANSKLSSIHNELKINHGSFTSEYPEQLMVVRYLKGNEKILEIGGNIGRNSLVIAKILKNYSNNNDTNLVVLESETNISNQLKENRNLNNFNFHIENSALSKRKLIQNWWLTQVSDEVLPGWTPVNIIDLDGLYSKYNIKFDTLILDCEGAFYYILMDMPEILDNVNLIIMENDYQDVSHKNYVNDVLHKNNFYIDYMESCPQEWSPHLYHCFFEVWKRK